jgi:hypothetical protein
MGMLGEVPDDSAGGVEAVLVWRCLCARLALWASTQPQTQPQLAHRLAHTH